MTRIPIVAAVALMVMSTPFVATQGPAGPNVETSPQYDLSGTWVPIVHEDASDRNVGVVYDTLACIPVNEAGRVRFESYSEDQVSLPEFQCRRDMAEYGIRGTQATLHILTEFAPGTQRIQAYNIYFPPGDPVAGTRTIYVDGRPHPSAEARHSWGGFSTGEWDGNMLNVETTHLKAFFVRRPAVAASDERTVTEHWIRHDDLLEMIMVIHDPVFFTEPLVYSQSWARSDAPQLPRIDSFCHASPELPSVGNRRVPFYAPGTNPAIKETIDNYGLPEEAMRGGAEMMYPEYRKQLKQTVSSLDRCKRGCNDSF
jgi:hypothetical protein